MDRDDEKDQRGTYSCLRSVIGILACGTDTDFDRVAQELQGFPHGVDPWVGRHWISHAVCDGAPRAVQWMLSKGVDLSFRDDEGYTVLHYAIDGEAPDKYEVLDLLLRHGAPVNARGINDWTPAHMAAARDDVDALRLLLQYGADLSIRTRETHSAAHDAFTPLEEARDMKATRAVAFLEHQQDANFDGGSGGRGDAGTT